MVLAKNDNNNSKWKNSFQMVMKNFLTILNNVESNFQFQKKNMDWKKGNNSKQENYFVSLSSVVKIVFLQ